MTNKSSSSGESCVVRTKQFLNQGEHSLKKEQMNEKDAGALQLVMPAVPFPCTCSQDSNAAVVFRSKLSLEDADLSQVGLKGETQTVCGFSINVTVTTRLATKMVAILRKIDRKNSHFTALCCVSVMTTFPSAACLS